MLCTVDNMMIELKPWFMSTKMIEMHCLIDSAIDSLPSRLLYFSYTTELGVIPLAMLAAVLCCSFTREALRRA